MISRKCYSWRWGGCGLVPRYRAFADASDPGQTYPRADGPAGAPAAELFGISPRRGLGVAWETLSGL